jgi:hypothetical protein
MGNGKEEKESIFFTQSNLALKTLKGLKNMFFKARFLLLQNIFSKEINIKGLQNHDVK